MKALIVDDSAVMRRVLTGALERVGISDVVEACDGAEGVECAGQYELGLILMDWNMPNMTGIEAVKAIRGAGSKVPIIMVTTEAEKTRVVEALKAGANNYAIKPFTPETLVGKITETLERAAV